MDQPMDDMMSPMVGPMDEPMGGGEPPMDDQTSGEDPLGGDMGGEQGGGADEISDIIGKLSLEDQAAVKKYAESLVSDNGGEEDAPIGESIEDITKRGEKRENNKIPRRYRGDDTNPFRSKF